MPGRGMYRDLIAKGQQERQQKNQGGRQSNSIGPGKKVQAGRKVQSPFEDQVKTNRQSLNQREQNSQTETKSPCIKGKNEKALRAAEEELLQELSTKDGFLSQDKAKRNKKIYDSFDSSYWKRGPKHTNGNTFVGKKHLKPFSFDEEDKSTDQDALEHNSSPQKRSPFGAKRFLVDRPNFKQDPSRFRWVSPNLKKETKPTSTGGLDGTVKGDDIDMKGENGDEKNAKRNVIINEKNEEFDKQGDHDVFPMNSAKDSIHEIEINKSKKQSTINHNFPSSYEASAVASDDVPKSNVVIEEENWEDEINEVADEAEDCLQLEEVKATSKSSLLVQADSGIDVGKNEDKPNEKCQESERETKASCDGDHGDVEDNDGGSSYTEESYTEESYTDDERSYSDERSCTDGRSYTDEGSYTDESFTEEGSYTDAEEGLSQEEEETEEYDSSSEESEHKPREENESGEASLSSESERSDTEDNRRRRRRLVKKSISNQNVEETESKNKKIEKTTEKSTSKSQQASIGKKNNESKNEEKVAVPRKYIIYERAPRFQKRQWKTTKLYNWRTNKVEVVHNGKRQNIICNENIANQSTSKSSNVQQKPVPSQKQKENTKVTKAKYNPSGSNTKKEVQVLRITAESATSQCVHDVNKLTAEDILSNVAQNMTDMSKELERLNVEIQHSLVSIPSFTDALKNTETEANAINDQKCQSTQETSKDDSPLKNTQAKIAETRTDKIKQALESPARQPKNKDKKTSKEKVKTLKKLDEQKNESVIPKLVSSPGKTSLAINFVGAKLKEDSSAVKSPVAKSTSEQDDKIEEACENEKENEITIKRYVREETILCQSKKNSSPLLDVASDESEEMQVRMVAPVARCGYEENIADDVLMQQTLTIEGTSQEVTERIDQSFGMFKSHWSPAEQDQPFWKAYTRQIEMDQDILLINGEPTPKSLSDRKVCSKNCYFGTGKKLHLRSPEGETRT